MVVVVGVVGAARPRHQPVSLPPARPSPSFFSFSFLCQFNGTGNSARLAAMLGEAGWVGEAEAPLGEAEIGGVPAACVGEAVR